MVDQEISSPAQQNSFFVKLFHFVKYSVALPYFNGILIGLGEFAFRFSTLKLGITKEDPLLTFVNPSALQNRLKAMQQTATSDIQKEGITSKIKSLFGKLFKK